VERRKPGMKVRLNVTTRGKSSRKLLHNEMFVNPTPPGYKPGIPSRKGETWQDN
jgi:hypothetical protein